MLLPRFNLWDIFHIDQFLVYIIIKENWRGKLDILFYQNTHPTITLSTCTALRRSWQLFDETKFHFVNVVMKMQHVQNRNTFRSVQWTYFLRRGLTFYIVIRWHLLIVLLLSNFRLLSTCCAAHRSRVIASQKKKCGIFSIRFKTVFFFFFTFLILWFTK